ncbi:unnamed protein product, partial [Mesorhabditis belari]|uniref:Myosin heavy chain n=1 Tax=Mesorhabditis belari TaxID=2138241 RepID=A0AAF3FLU1_9BILA
MVDDPSYQADWASKRFVWVPHETEGFLLAQVKEELANGLLRLIIAETGEEKTAFNDDVQRTNPPKFEKTEDMANLTMLNEAGILHNLKSRYFSDLIYTYSGMFCVVVNPYKKMPIYMEEIADGFRGKNRTDVPPHIFAVTDAAYRNMLQNREDQSILCTGESGAGKTENTKKVIQYLTLVAGQIRQERGLRGSVTSLNTSNANRYMGNLEEQLLHANPILEAFGNSKTIKNDNSSRFGKFIKIHFDARGLIAGASIEFYLLEKSRVIHQAPKERAFHIFYQLLKGADSKLADELLLEATPNAYRFLSNGDTSIPNVNDREEFRNLVAALNVMGLSDEEVGGRESFVRSQTAEQAEFTAEAIAKACYERLFRWLVQRINRSLDRTRQNTTSFIGILDIAGFEIFEKNGFEQLCINYCNEKLQQLFNHHMFIQEQEEYKREGVKWNFVDFGHDLQPTIDLIDKNMGVMALLDDTCLFPKADDKNFVEKLIGQHKDHAKFIPPEARSKGAFALMHYAGRVDYSADGWRMKNMDPLNDNVVDLLQHSSDQIVAEMWKHAEFASIASTESCESIFGARAKKGMFRTQCQLYKEQLSRLMSTLENTNPHFVRCIIPNYEKKPGKITAPLVLEQLRCNGVVEGIRIARQGYPNRLLFQEFRQRYERILCPDVIPKGFMDGKEACRLMLEHLAVDTAIIGKTKVFFKAGQLAILEQMRDEKITNLIVAFQAHCRGNLARREFKRRTEQANAIRIIQRNGLAWMKLRGWHWWRLFMKMKPLLEITKTDEVIAEKDDAIKNMSEKLRRSEVYIDDCGKRIEVLNEDRARLQQRLELETAERTDADEERQRLNAKKTELEEELMHISEQMKQEMAKASRFESEKKKLQTDIRDLEVQLSAEENTRHKLIQERTSFEKKLRDLELTQAEMQESNARLTKEKRSLEARVQQLQEKLIDEEERHKNIQKVNGKTETDLAALQENARRETGTLLKKISALEMELADAKELIEEEKRNRNLIASKLRTKDEEYRAMEEQHDDLQRDRDRLNKENFALKQKEAELQKKIDLDAEEKKKSWLEKKQNDPKKKLIQENEDLMNEVGLSNAALSEAQRQQRKHDQLLAEEKALRDDVNRDKEMTMQQLRDLETKNLQLVQDLNRLKEKNDELEKAKKVLQLEVDSLTSNEDASGKTVFDLEKAKRFLEEENIRLGEQIIELEDECQILDDKNSRYEVQMNAMRAELARDREQREQEEDDNRRQATKQIRELEEQLEEERRQKSVALAAKRKAENNAQFSNESVESLTRQIEELNRQVRQARRAETRLAEINTMLEAEKQNSERCKEMADRSAQRQRQLKRQIEELEEDVDREKMKNRQLNHEINDLQEGNDRLTTENSRLTARMNAIDRTSVRPSMARGTTRYGSNSSLRDSFTREGPEAFDDARSSSGITGSHGARLSDAGSDSRL